MKTNLILSDDIHVISNDMQYRIALSERWWNHFQLYWSLLHIVYWKSVKGYLRVHRQWRPIANTCANASLYLLNFTALLHIKLSSPIITDTAWVILTFMSQFIIKQAVKLNSFTSKQYWHELPSSLPYFKCYIIKC